jgi:hypothetical protein
MIGILRTRSLWRHNRVGKGSHCDHAKGSVWGARRSTLKPYEREREDIEAGPTSRQEAIAVGAADLVNQFLTGKRDEVHFEELTLRIWAEYHVAAEWIVDILGKVRDVGVLRPIDLGGLLGPGASRPPAAPGGQPVIALEGLPKVRKVRPPAEAVRIVCGEPVPDLPAAIVAIRDRLDVRAARSVRARLSCRCVRKSAKGSA